MQILIEKTQRARNLNSLKLAAALGALLICAGTGRAQTVSTFDILIATETLTVVGTTTLVGNGFSVGASTFVVNQGRIGIGTATPSVLFQMVSAPIQGNGAQFQWIASSGALRVGEFSGTQWNPMNIGVFSVAFGLNNKVNGPFATATGGHENTASGDSSFIGAGYSNSIGSGDISVITGGQLNSIAGTANFMGGAQATLLQVVIVLPQSPAVPAIRQTPTAPSAVAFLTTQDMLQL